MLKNYRAFDGYTLTSDGYTDGYSFSTEWFDLVNAVNIAYTATFVGGSPAGTLSLQGSCDVPDLIYKTFPRSAGGPYGTATDQFTVTGSSATISAAGVNFFATAVGAFRFARITYAASSSIHTVVSVYVCAKTNDGNG